MVITREYHFSAAHLLPNHDGQCRRLHGHNYRLLVTIGGPVYVGDGDTEEGMVMDFVQVDNIVRPIIDELDHRFIAKGDEWPYLLGQEYAAATPDNFVVIGARSTVENILTWLAATIRLSLRGTDRELARITLYETERNSATWEIQ